MNELGNALRNLYDMFPVKALASMLMVIAMDSRAIIFYSFAWLVILDCFTRWLAISYKYAVETGVERPSLYKAFVGIPAARRVGLIRSDVMREQGVTKLLLYNICAIAAGACDLILFELHSPMWFMTVVVGYLALTELLSIIENLSDAGVESMGRLVTKLKGRL